ncbi:hypothetical protein ABZ605_27725 [Streptomyces sp. NPDC012765]|uniref:hypothetical protein n=1 Tax=Streptomyces sp. NPDC012765 TaxID=3155249 RepID=UPI0033DA081E
MTKSGSDHLKHRARAIARTTGRRFPDVLAELRRAPRRAPAPGPSKALVPVCSSFVHPLDGGDCARPAGHHRHDPGWSSCSEDPHYPVHIWHGFHVAQYDAETAEQERWLASLTPEERAEHEEALEGESWDAMAADAADPYDDRYDKYRYLDDESDDPDTSDESAPGAYADDEHDDGDWDEEYP